MNRRNFLKLMSTGGIASLVNSCKIFKGFNWDPYKDISDYTFLKNNYTGEIDDYLVDIFIHGDDPSPSSLKEITLKAKNKNIIPNKIFAYHDKYLGEKFDHEIFIIEKCRLSRDKKNRLIYSEIGKYKIGINEAYDHLRVKDYTLYEIIDENNLVPIIEYLNNAYVLDAIGDDYKYKALLYRLQNGESIFNFINPTEENKKDRIPIVSFQDGDGYIKTSNPIYEEVIQTYSRKKIDYFYGLIEYAIDQVLPIEESWRLLYPKVEKSFLKK